jgi:hypothetical protein
LGPILGPAFAIVVSLRGEREMGVLMRYWLSAAATMSEANGRSI